MSVKLVLRQKKPGFAFAPASGFSLPEILVVLAIIGLLAGISAVSMRQFIARQKINQVSEALSQTIRFTREIAVITRHESILCPAGAKRQCSNAKRWQSYWLVNSQIGHGDRAGTFSSVFMTSTKSLRILSTSSNGRLRFSARGLPAGTAGSLVICHPRWPKLGKKVVLSAAGRLRTISLDPRSIPGKCKQALPPGG